MYSQLYTKEVDDLILNFEKVTGQRPSPFNIDGFGTVERYKEYLRHCDVNEKHPAWQDNEEFIAGVIKWLESQKNK